VGTKKDALPALVKAMATFVMTRPSGPTPIERHVDKLFQARRLVAERLLKMNGFWSELRFRRVQQTYVEEQWKSLNTVAKIPDDGASPRDKACALLFHAAVGTFSSPRVVTLHDIDRAKYEADGTIVLIPYDETLVWTRDEIEQKAAPLCIAAEQCMIAAERCRIEAKNHPHLREHLALADALLSAGNYFEKQFDLNVKLGPSVVVGPGDRDGVRTQVVELATEMQRLYGFPSHGTTAQIAAAALDDTTIGTSQARNWWDSFAGQ
jgi:hypothetical protein